MFKNMLKTMFRNIIRQKSYTTINVTGLAMGLAACMILFMWIQYHLSFDQFHEKADRIYRPIIRTNTSGLNQLDLCGSPGLLADLITSEYPEIENRVRLFRPREAVQIRNGETVIAYRDLFYTDPSFFAIFSFDFKYGDPAISLADPGGIVLSEETALALFGDENPIGRQVVVDGQANFFITGVLKKLPLNSHLRFKVLAPFNKTWLADYIKNHQYDSDFLSYLLFRPGTNLTDLETKMADLIDKYYPEFGRERLQIYFQPLKKIHLYSANIDYNQWSWRSLNIAYIYLFVAIAVLILFVAAINYINLATARARRRAKEVGIRKTTGATRIQLILQFMGESVVLTFFAMLLGFILIELGLPLLNELFENELNFGYVNRLHLLGFMSLLALFVGIVTGWYPAIVLSKPMPYDAFTISKSKGGKGISLRRCLVVAQFCVTMLLIVFSLTIEKQLRWIQSQNLGFNKAQVVTFSMVPPVQRNLETIRQNLLQNSWVSGVSAMGPFDLSGFQGKQFWYEGQIQDDLWVTSCSSVDYHFVQFYGLTITEGRDFSEQLETDKNGAYIINETLKKKLGWETAVGKQFWIKEHMPAPGIVVGVVNDFNFRSLHDKVEGCALFIKPEVLKHIAVRAQPEKIPELISTMREIWKQYAPDAAFEYYFYDDFYAHLYLSDQKVRKIVNAFSLLTLFVAGIGLLGLISYSTEQRTKEIGIRKVHGASMSNILILLSREFFILLSLAVVVAWPVAWVLARRWLQNFAYHTQVDWGIFFISWAITLVLAMLTMAGQVLRAANANPVKALRYE